MIARAGVTGGGATPAELAIAAARWASVAGARCSFSCSCRRCCASCPASRVARPGVRARAHRAAEFPARCSSSRGVVQISATSITCSRASCPAAWWRRSRRAQTLYMLPVSLFGMSVSAAELPEMSSATGDAEAIGAALRGRARARAPADRVLRGAVGGRVPGARRRHGRRCCSRRPIHARGHAVRVGHSRRLGGRPARHHAGAAVLLDVLRAARHAHAAALRARPRDAHHGARADSRPLAAGLLGIDPHWGAAGLTASAGIAGWVEFALLRRALTRASARAEFALGFVARCGSPPSWRLGSHGGSDGRHDGNPILLAIFTLIPYGIACFASSAAMGIQKVKRHRAVVLATTPSLRVGVVPLEGVHGTA